MKRKLIIFKMIEESIKDRNYQYKYQKEDEINEANEVRLSLKEEYDEELKSILQEGLRNECIKIEPIKNDMQNVISLNEKGQEILDKIDELQEDYNYKVSSLYDDYEILSDNDVSRAVELEGNSTDEQYLIIDAIKTIENIGDKELKEIILKDLERNKEFNSEELNKLINIYVDLVGSNRLSEYDEILARIEE